jgi:Prp8 binding protein
VLEGHKNAVLEVKWASNGVHILSSSADKTVAVWDSNKGKRIRKYSEHTAIVNSLSSAKNEPNIFASASDDCTVLIWDSRCRKAVNILYHDYQVYY